MAADITWTGAGDGTSWSQAANWNPQVVPGEGDDVIITLPGTYTVVLNATVSVNSIMLGGESGTQTLRKSSGTLTLAAASRIGPNGVLEMLAGYITGDGVLTNEGTILADAPSWTGINNSTLINEGELVHERGIFYIASSALFENRGLYRIAGDLNISESGAMGT
ncbi:MAG: hypothetical protein ABR545_05350, partial [Cyclonatronaceae bacterium]